MQKKIWHLLTDKQKLRKVFNMDFNELYKVDVSKNIEKKNGFNYLSWTYAWKHIQTIEPDSSYEVKEYDGLPVCYFKDGSAQVTVTVTIKGVSRSMWLAVTDFKNKAIINPSSVDISNSTMRCFVKAIAMHGLGLHIYAGEDVPKEDDPVDYTAWIEKARVSIHVLTDIEDVNKKWQEIVKHIKDKPKKVKDACQLIYSNKIAEISGN